MKTLLIILSIFFAAAPLQADQTSESIKNGIRMARNRALANSHQTPQEIDSLQTQDKLDDIQDQLNEIEQNQN